MEGIFEGLEKVAQLLLEAQQSCNNQRTKIELVCEDCKKLLKEWEKESRPKILEESKKQVDKTLFVTKRKSDEVPVIKEMMLAENLLLTARKLKDKHQRIFHKDKTPVLTTVTNIPHKGSPEHSSKSCFPTKDMKRLQCKNVEKSAAIHKFRSKSKSPVRKNSLIIHDGYSSSDTNRNIEIHSPLLNIRKKFTSDETKIMQTLPTVVLSKSKAEQLQQIYGIVLLTEGKDNVGVSPMEKQGERKACTAANTADIKHLDSFVDNTILGSSIPDPSERFKKAVSYNLQARNKVKQLLKLQNRNEHAKIFQTKVYGTMIHEKHILGKLTDSEAGKDETVRNLFVQCSCNSFPNWMWYPSLSLIGPSSLSETLAYNNIMEVCQFYSLLTDIQWYSFLLDIFKLIEDEILPYLDKFNLNDSNFPNVFRCLWSILCTEGRAFPILIRKL